MDGDTATDHRGTISVRNTAPNGRREELGCYGTVN
jgi:hypothetical protein